MKRSPIRWQEGERSSIHYEEDEWVVLILLVPE